MERKCVIDSEPITPDSTIDSIIGTMHQVMHENADGVNTNIGLICKKHAILYRKVVSEILGADESLRLKPKQLRQLTLARLQGI